ncbi:MAG TPA: type I restriction enzyme HsdR N-terminal domain-containing protein [Nodularia sp. (in: cyanobacteria)]|nr:type I restriction enzyme HsdR N-terminal domain-containing protein [Nodularia sp. (in: cyanobacteria)]
MTYLNQEMQQKLDIYSKKYNQQYTKCLFRGIEIPLDGRPEELVRQLFLHFIIKESGLFPDLINIKVESNNHDIEIYKKHQNSNFTPHQTPLVIVEVKREEVNLQNYYNQIQRYLTKAGCHLGILYNYHDIIAFVRKNDEFEINYLESLKDIEELIIPKDNRVAHGLLEFEKAQNGNFDSFIYLIDKYGKYTTNTVTFKIKSEQSEIEGYLFDVRENKIYYKMCGKYSKKSQSFDVQDFEKLIAIRY